MLSELQVGVPLEQLLGTVVLEAHGQAAIVTFTFYVDDCAQAELGVAHASAHQGIAAAAILSGGTVAGWPFVR